jgi:hypothetical protein
MDNIHLKKCCSTSLAIKKMKIKMTSRFHLIPVRMIIIKNTNNKSRQGCGEKGILTYCWWKCKLVWPLWKSVWRFLKKLKLQP